MISVGDLRAAAVIRSIAGIAAGIVGCGIDEGISGAISGGLYGHFSGYVIIIMHAHGNRSRIAENQEIPEAAGLVFHHNIFCAAAGRAFCNEG